MKHDGIEQAIEVADISVRVYERSGWKVVTDDQPTDRETAAAQGRRRAKGES